jgi:hypothetical protein
MFHGSPLCTPVGTNPIGSASFSMEVWFQLPGVGSNGGMIMSFENAAGVLFGIYV